jgi:Uma2 family endonuclease
VEDALEAVVEATIDIRPYSLPEPDVVVTSAKPSSDYIPLPMTRIVFEVADTSRQYDLGIKREIYAKAGIPEYVVVDLTTNSIETFTDPQGGDYDVHRTLPFGEVWTSATVSRLSIDTVDLI